MFIERGMYRNRKLLDLCHNAPCFLLIDRVCRSGVNPSVPCHSNHQRHGRGKDNKAHDCFTVPGCPECHYWLDFGPATREDKDQAFMAGLERWLLHLWRRELIKLA
jgi:hypothetical protein